MKMLTHIVFGAGSAMALLASYPYDVRLVLALGTSLVVNFVIDVFGHTMHGHFVARSPLTHSVVTAPLWGGALGYILWEAGTSFGIMGARLEAAFVGAGVVVALAHLLLDSLTERGVYFVTKCMALAHFGSGDDLLNGLFLALGIVLFLS